MAEPVDISPERIAALTIRLLFMAETGGLSEADAGFVRDGACALMAMHTRFEEVADHIAQYEADLRDLRQVADGLRLAELFLSRLGKAAGYQGGL
ncbi:MAG: hypothetical protein HQL42_15515 [Alphaproteobacteria bacterium]|nr:hypothetical protein [Alphaproteobacteria bacterium]